MATQTTRPPQPVLTFLFYTNILTPTYDSILHIFMSLKTNEFLRIYKMEFILQSILKAIYWHKNSQDQGAHKLINGILSWKYWISSLNVFYVQKPISNKKIECNFFACMIFKIKIFQHSKNATSIWDREGYGGKIGKYYALHLKL